MGFTGGHWVGNPGGGSNTQWGRTGAASGQALLATAKVGTKAPVAAATATVQVGSKHGGWVGLVWVGGEHCVCRGVLHSPSVNPASR